MPAVIISAYQQLVEYLAQKASPQEILDFNISEEEQERARTLMERDRDGELTPLERMELDQMAYFDRLVSTLKAKALEALQS